MLAAQSMLEKESFICHKNRNRTVLGPTGRLSCCTIKRERRRMTLEGQFQIHTGDGKGKTTAAPRLAVRAEVQECGCTSGSLSRTRSTTRCQLLRRLGVVVELWDRQGMSRLESIRHRRIWDAAADGLKKAQAALQSGQYDLVILDEINVAWQLGLCRKPSLNNWQSCAHSRWSWFIPDAAARPHCFNWGFGHRDAGGQALLPHQRAVGAGRD